MNSLSAFSNRVVLITGASTGIGRALLKKLWNSPLRVIGTARESSLQRLSTTEFPTDERRILLPLDVTNDREREEIVNRVNRHFGGVDILINNAGVCVRSVMEDLSAEEFQKQLDVNTVAPLSLIRLVLPHMRKQRWGRIINVSSVGGMMAMPTMGAYSASKFALEGACESLWYELRPWNIPVSIVQPGFINSDGFRRVLWTKAAAEACKDKGPYRKYYAEMVAFIEKIMVRTTATPDSIANKIIKVMVDSDPALRVPVTLDAHLSALFRRFVPRSLYHAILYRALPGIKHWVSEEQEVQIPSVSIERSDTGTHGPRMSDM